ncbi:hypothetical protein [Longispora albida]|uniref:hypothetical protein n=1 Tax=Longispora albida TaxID=203523 RepID=UPI0003613A92|nr:hypothetical protein [Longispora albida]
MNQPSDDNLLRSQLTLLSEDVTSVDLRDRVLTTSRKLAFQRSAMLSGSALAVIGLVAGSAFALAPSTPEASVPAGTTQPTVAAAPEQTPEQSAAPAPVQTVTPGSTAGAGSTKPSFQPIDLRNATLTIPGWQTGLSQGFNNDCSGMRKLTNGRTAANTTGHLEVMDAVAADVDRDGSQDAVGLFKCQGQQGDARQIIAFGRTADGGIRTIGTVVATSNTRKPGTDLAQILTVKAAGDGSISAKVGDFAGMETDAIDAKYRIDQERVYRWNGQRFAQTGGPASFPANPNFARLAVSSTDLAFGPAVNGKRQGTLKVTLANQGAGDAELVWAVVYVPLNVSAAGPLPDNCTLDGTTIEGRGIRCMKLSTIKAGASRVLEFKLALDTRTAPDTSNLTISLNGDHPSGLQPSPGVGGTYKLTLA